MRTKNLLMHSVWGIGAALLIANPSFAQTTQTLPDAATTSANPSRVQEQFQSDTVIPDVGGGVEVESPVLQNMPANADQITFKLNSLTIEGVSAYQDTDVSYLYEDRVGTTISLADLYKIADSLTRKYRNEGYILSQVVVPPQTIDGGSVQLRVVEGYIDRVIVQGDDQESALNLVRTYANQIRADGALNVKDLERYLLLINDLPGLSARSVLSPSRTQTGASDLRIIVERDHFDGLLGVDNFGSRYLGPIQLTAAGALNSYFGNNEEITAQFVMAPDPDHVELAYGALSYEQPIFNNGTTARAFISHSSTKPGFDLRQFNVEGHSTFFGVGVEHPFIRSRVQNLSGRVQFDWRDVESQSDLEATREDRLRTLRAGGRYEFLDTLFGVGINSVDVEVSKGLNIFGASDGDAPNITRPNADTTFHKLNVEAQRLQRITSDINLLVAARGQVANDALLSSEEFGVGGINFGRGFEPSEIVGDDGFATKVEVQWQQPTPWSLVQDYQIFGFWDFGKVYNDDATINDDDESLASVGAGVRTEFLDNTEAGLAVAFPLTRDVQTQGDDDPRVYFNLNRRF